MRALSIRQPFAELILRGIKTMEYRSRPTKIIGERFWIYASKAPVTLGTDAATFLARGRESTGTAPKMTSDNLSTDAVPPPWIIELAEALKLFGDGIDLPRGVIVGSAVIEKVTPLSVEGSGMYRWHLAGVERATDLRRPMRQPQPVWFEPFAA